MTKKPSAIDGPRLSTLSGRSIQAPPQLATGTARCVALNGKRIDDWLLREAMREALTREDDHALGVFIGLVAADMPESCRADLSQYLFGRDGVRLLKAREGK